MKRTTYGLRRASAGEPRHVFLREALDRDAVDLDRPKLGVTLGLLEPAQDLVERVAPRQLREANVVERVERDVDPAEPRVDERLREPVEQHAVRRQREIADARSVARACATSTGRSRRTSGSPPVRRTSSTPSRASTRDEPRDLLEGQHLVARKPLEPLGGHAVRAAEVALVGDRDADALDLAAPAVDERLHVESLARGFRRCRSEKDVTDIRLKGGHDGRRTQGSGRRQGQGESRASSRTTRTARARARPRTPGATRRRRPTTSRTRSATAV